MSNINPRIVLGIRAFNNLSHRSKVAYRKTAKQYNAVMFKATYDFTK